MTHAALQLPRKRGRDLAALVVLVVLHGCALPDEGLEPGSCDDKIDNDGDYKFDCNDPGCADSPVCATVDDDDADSGDGGTDDTDDTDDTADTDDTGRDTGPLAECNASPVTLLGHDGEAQTVRSWVWRALGDEVALLGFLSDGRDGCEIATGLAADDGDEPYSERVVRVDLTAAEPGTYTFQATAVNAGDAAIRVEHLETGEVETSVDSGGTITVTAVESGGSLVASDITATLSAGTILAGAFQACTCEAVPESSGGHVRAP